jgi:putative serine protease PepD
MSHLGSRISALVDGQLSVADTEKALAHVAVCPECSAELAASRAARRALASADEVAPAPDLTARLLSLGCSPDPFAPPVRQSRDELASYGAASGGLGGRRGSLRGDVGHRRSSVRIAAGSMAGLGAVAAMLFMLGERPDVVPTVHPGVDLGLLGQAVTVEPTSSDGQIGTTGWPVADGTGETVTWLRAHAWSFPTELPAGAVGGVLGSRLGEDDHLADAGLPVAPAGSRTIERAPDSVAGIAAGVLPSVVSIQVDGPEGSATGSGFVLRGDGYLVTNNHVIAQTSDAAATTITVTFGDGSELEASVVGKTSDYDLAVLKVDVDGLTPLVLGDSDQVVVGDAVVAVGAPLGLAGTVTTGIVSALNRPVSAGEATDSSDQAFINAIQTDAAINPGNSGGPLVNAAGEVIGINSAIAQPPGSTSLVGGSIGLGFAIPSNQVRRTSTQLIETGHATYPIIGVLLDERYTGEGVQVSSSAQQDRQPVTADGPAERAGIHPGDVILAIDGRPVTDPDELIVAIRARTPGDTIVLHVRSGSNERDVRVKLDESPTD